MRKGCVKVRKDANVKPPGNSLSAFYAILLSPRISFPLDHSRHRKLLWVFRVNSRTLSVKISFYRILPSNIVIFDHQRIFSKWDIYNSIFQIYFFITHYYIIHRALIIAYLFRTKHFDIFINYFYILFFILSVKICNITRSLKSLIIPTDTSSTSLWRYATSLSAVFASSYEPRASRTSLNIQNSRSPYGSTIVDADGEERDAGRFDNTSARLHDRLAVASLRGKASARREARHPLYSKLRENSRTNFRQLRGFSLAQVSSAVSGYGRATYWIISYLLTPHE